MSRGLLFWRSFTHWVGGMGVLVFIMALVPNMSDRSIHIMRAEMPGPVVGKLLPRARDTASILYKIYVAMTLVQIVLLVAGGMPLFESVLHAFGTAGTGGFAGFIQNDGQLPALFAARPAGWIGDENLFILDTAQHDEMSG